MHSDMAATLHQLGRDYLAMEKYTEAQDFYSQALAMYKRVHGEAHPDMASTLHGLGSVHHAKKEYQKAQDYYTQSLSMKCITYKTDIHPKIAVTLHSLGCMHYEEGNYELAQENLMKSLHIKYSVYGENAAHSEIAATLFSLAQINEQREKNKSRYYYQTALTMYQRLPDEQHTLNKKIIIEKLAI